MTRTWTDAPKSEWKKINWLTLANKRCIKPVNAFQKTLHCWPATKGGKLWFIGENRECQNGEMGEIRYLGSCASGSNRKGFWDTCPVWVLTVTTGYPIWWIQWSMISDTWAGSETLLAETAWWNKYLVMGKYRIVLLLLFLFLPLSCQHISCVFLQLPSKQMYSTLGTNAYS